MRVLLDTHVWLWLQVSPERFGSRARALVEDAANDLLFSAASSWEIAIKYARGRLPLPMSPEHYVPDRIRRSGVTPIAVEHSHALRVADLPDHHRDPFDRLLVAQSQLADVPLLTNDDALGAYDVETLAATR